MHDYPFNICMHHTWCTRNDRKFEKWNTEKEKAIDMYRLLYSILENSKFSVTLNLEFSCEVRQQIALLSFLDSFNWTHLHSVIRRFAAIMWYSEITNCYSQMVYSLEHLIFFVLQSPYLHHDILENMRSFQKIFNDTKNPKMNTVNFLLDNFHWR